MLKNILVALDESASSQRAKLFSIALAGRMKADLTGLAVLNEPWITAPEALPIGGAAYKIELDQELLKDAKRRIRVLEKAFEEDCTHAGLPHTLLDTTGIPAHEIERLVTPFDLLVIGDDADFHFHPSDGTAVSVQQLVQDNPRPLIVTSAASTDGEGFLMAYDGTFASSRALHMALLLGLTPKGKTHLVTVVKDEAGKKDVRDMMTMAIKLCESHGVKASLHIAVAAHAAPALLNLAKEIKPTMIGMGAFGHKGILNFLKGSCTHKLLEDSSWPLFVYH